jgi:hypothetical protein
MPDGAQIEPQDDRTEPDEPVGNGFIFGRIPVSGRAIAYDEIGSV